MRALTLTQVFVKLVARREFLLRLVHVSRVLPHEWSITLITSTLYRSIFPAVPVNLTLSPVPLTALQSGGEFAKNACRGKPHLPLLLFV